jgi:hypothetical protein
MYKGPILHTVPSHLDYGLAVMEHGASLFLFLGSWYVSILDAFTLLEQCSGTCHVVYSRVEVGRMAQQLQDVELLGKPFEESRKHALGHYLAGTINHTPQFVLHKATHILPKCFYVPFCL